MKRAAWLALLIASMAFTPIPEKVTDKKAKDILDATSKKIHSFKTIKIDFSITESAEKKADITRKGRVWLKQNKYNLRLAGQEVYCDGKTKWTYIKDAEEVHISNVKEDEDELANPLNLLKNYQKRFTARWIKEETQKGKKLDIIDLYPRKVKGYHRVRLRIAQSDRQIMSTTVYQVSNASQNVEVDKFVTNEAIKDEYFVWDPKKHPGVEVIDLRKKK
ncbi:MAG TPA: outer membrane lipoprotein carrier protein LolA [Bacteroidales bacterium]|nr:outer membrane lipoprotein carrier protein LolA [Bacteroidales bacterium]HRZ48106.1 outer membrane lipoprotein carrier protein LolA [Bacteroidales bacterium]